MLSAWPFGGRKTIMSKFIYPQLNCFEVSQMIETPACERIDLSKNLLSYYNRRGIQISHMAWKERQANLDYKILWEDLISEDFYLVSVWEGVKVNQIPPPASLFHFYLLHFSDKWSCKIFLHTDRFSDISEIHDYYCLNLVTEGHIKNR